MHRFAESTSLKHIATGAIAFVGSNTPNAFTEYPADDLIIDEMDRCNAENLIMADERLSASKNPMKIKISNPTINGFAIDDEYAASDKKEWYIKCSRCGKWIKPDFFKHIVKHVGDNNYVLLDKTWDKFASRDLKLYCHKCNRSYDRFALGEWQGSKRSNISGYHVSKMFSTNIKIRELLTRFEKGLENDLNMQRFYNGDLGLPYIAKGAKIDYMMLDECKQDYLMPKMSKNVCVAGVDVGNVLHVKISEVVAEGKLRAVYIGTVNDYEDIKELYIKYNIRCGCIDALPEKRLAKKICTSLKGFFMVYYADVKKDTIDAKRKILTVDRTASLDNVKEAYLTKAKILPRNANEMSPMAGEDNVSQFYYEMCTSTRVFNEDKQKYSWVEGSKPDHFLHADNYESLAKKLLVTFRL